MLTLEEVRLEVHVEDVAAEALDGVVERQNVHTLSVLDVQALMYVYEITELDTQVVTGDFVHLDLALLDVVGAQTDENGISPLLTPANSSEHVSDMVVEAVSGLPDDDCVATE